MVEFVLKFSAKPQIVHLPEQVQANIESTVTLQCRVIGTPTPKIRLLNFGSNAKKTSFYLFSWTKDRKPIEFAGGRYSILSEDRLMIKDIKIEDKGYFSCEARNEFGIDVKNTLLTITGLG